MASLEDVRVLGKGANVDGGNWQLVSGSPFKENQKKNIKQEKSGEGYPSPEKKKKPNILLF